MLYYITAPYNVQLKLSNITAICVSSNLATIISVRGNVTTYKLVIIVRCFAQGFHIEITEFSSKVKTQTNYFYIIKAALQPNDSSD